MPKNSYLVVGTAAAVAALGVAAIALVASTGQAAPAPSPGQGHYSYDGSPQAPEEVTQEEFERRTKILDEASERLQPDFGVEHLDDYTE